MKLCHARPAGLMLVSVCLLGGLLYGLRYSTQLQALTPALPLRLAKAMPAMPAMPAMATTDTKHTSSLVNYYCSSSCSISLVPNILVLSSTNVRAVARGGIEYHRTARPEEGLRLEYAAHLKRCRRGGSSEVGDGVGLARILRIRRGG